MYAVVAFYLTHRKDVDEYLREQETAAESLWNDIRGRADYQEFRQRLLARRQSDQS